MKIGGLDIPLVEKSKAFKRNATRIESYHKFPCFSSISCRSAAYYCQQIEHAWCRLFPHYEKASSNPQFSRIRGSIEFLGEKKKKKEEENLQYIFLKRLNFRRSTREQILFSPLKFFLKNFFSRIKLENRDR